MAHLDALRSSTFLEYFFNDLQHGWQTVRVVERRPSAEFPSVYFPE